MCVHSFVYQFFTFFFCSSAPRRARTNYPHSVAAPDDSDAVVRLKANVRSALKWHIAATDLVRSLFGICDGLPLSSRTPSHVFQEFFGPDDVQLPVGQPGRVLGEWSLLQACTLKSRTARWYVLCTAFCTATSSLESTKVALRRHSLGADERRSRDANGTRRARQREEPAGTDVHT